MNEFTPGNFFALLGVALPLIIGAVTVAVVFFKAYKFQKELKTQSDELFKKLEDHEC